MAAAPEHGAGPVKRALLIGLLLIPLLLIGALLALLGTRAGNLWLLDRAGPYLPGELSVEEWRGNLLSGVDVGALNYRQGDAEQTLAVALNDLHLELAPGELLGGWLVIQAVRAEQVTLTLPAGAAGGTGRAALRAAGQPDAAPGRARGDPVGGPLHPGRRSAAAHRPYRGPRAGRLAQAQPAPRRPERGRHPPARQSQRPVKRPL